MNRPYPLLHGRGTVFCQRQQVAVPLNNLMTATDQIAAGDFNIELG